jgi:hypothetical protein
LTKIRFLLRFSTALEIFGPTRCVDAMIICWYKLEWKEASPIRAP